MERELDLTKPMQTRNGIEVEWFVVVPESLENAIERRLLVILRGDCCFSQHYTDGRVYREYQSEHDLVNVTKKITFYHNVYKTKTSGKYFACQSFDDYESAVKTSLAAAGSNCEYIKTINVTFED